jgi:hypothetical protein
VIRFIVSEKWNCWIYQRHYSLKSKNSFVLPKGIPDRTDLMRNASFVQLNRSVDHIEAVNTGEDDLDWMDKGILTNPSKQICLSFNQSVPFTVSNQLPSVHCLKLQNISGLPITVIQNASILFLDKCRFSIAESNYVINAKVVSFTDVTHVDFGRLKFPNLKKLVLFRCRNVYNIYLYECLSFLIQRIILMLAMFLS